MTVHLMPKLHVDESVHITPALPAMNCVVCTRRHMIACTLLSGALAAARLVPVQHISSARQFGKVTVLAIVFCVTVVLGNISLKYIPVSFNQVGMGLLPSMLLLVLAMVSNPA
jgi:hypothetical protein